MGKVISLRILKFLNNKPQILRTIASVMFIVFFVVFIKSLQSMTWDNIWKGLLTLSLSQIFQAVGATFLSYYILGIVEFLNCKKLGIKIKFRDAMYMSLTANAISNHFSFAGLSGAAVRVKHFENKGLDTKSALYLTIFNSISLWAGFFIAMSVTLLFFSIPKLSLGNLINSDLLSPFLLAISLLVLFSFFFFYTKVIVKKMEARFNVSLPKLLTLMPNFALTGLDWIVSGVVLYALMPQSFEVSFGSFLAVFLAAQLLGIILSVPAGIGILETIILSIHFGGDSVELMGSLVLFRLIYYIIPLGFCLFSFGIVQLRKSSPLFYVSIKNLVQIFNTKSSPILSFMVFVQGFLLVNIKFTKLEPLQMLLVTSVFPIELVKYSQYLSIFAGITLMVLAIGLFIRSNLAWILSLGVCALGIILSLVSSLQVEQSGYLILSVFLLIWYRKEFYRPAWFFSRRMSYRWLTVTAVISMGAFLVIGSSPGRTISSVTVHDVAISFSFFFRLLLNNYIYVCFAIVQIALLILMIPSFGSRFKKEKREQIPADVCKIISKSSFTLSQIAYLGDKKFHFNSDRSGFIMYRTRGNSWISMGDPVGKNANDTIKTFTKAAYNAGGNPLFYQIRRDQVAEYYDLGYKVIKIGEEALIDVKKFEIEGPAMHSLRNSYKRVRKTGVEFKIFTPGQFLERKSEFEELSNKWLKKTFGKEKGFSLGNFDVNYLSRYFHAVLLKDNIIIAFANIWRSEDHFEISVDLMRYSSEAPSGAMDYLFLCLIRYAKEKGYKTFNLGMSPLAGLEQAESPFWNVVGAFLFENGDRFYNFKGVRDFKNKYGPRWEGRYVAYRGTIGAAVGLVNIVHMISHPSNIKEAA